MDSSRNKNLNKLNILQWNIQGIRARYQELSTILRNRKVSVACLQETLLGDASWRPSQNYKIEKSPHTGGDQNRGVAVMVHITLQYTRVQLFTTLEAVAVTVNSNKQYTICSIYLSHTTAISTGMKSKTSSNSSHDHSYCWEISMRNTQCGT